MFDMLYGDVSFNISGLGSHTRYYDAVIVEMRPEDFLSVSSHLPVPRQGSIDFLRTAMLERSICPPLLHFYRGNLNNKVIKHEGRHRATISRELGLDFIPVAISGVAPDELEKGFIDQNNVFRDSVLMRSV